MSISARPARELSGVRCLTKSPTLSWPAQEGASYRVEYKSDLSETSWRTLESAVVSIFGSRAYARDLLPLGTQKFYRVVAFPVP